MPKPKKLSEAATVEEFDTVWRELWCQDTVVKNQTATQPAQVNPATKASQQALSVVEESKKYLAIHSLEEEQAAGSFRREVVAPAIREVKEAFDPVVKTAKDAYDTARSQRARYLDPLEQADETIRRGAAAYLQELERQRREQERQAQREQAERERQAVLEREQSRKSREEELDEALSQLPLDVSQDRIDELVASFEKESEVDSAPVEVVTVRVSQPPTSGQFVLQENWKGEVTDLVQVMRQVLAGTLPVSLLQAVGPEVNRLAKLHKGTKKFPGLRFWNEPFTRSR